MATPVIALPSGACILLLGAASTSILADQTIAGSHFAAASAFSGACAAAACSLIFCRERGKGGMHQILALLASLTIGGLLPKIIVWWKFESRLNTLPFEAWSMMGFVCGLAGLPTVAALNALFSSRIPQVLGRLADRFLGESKRDKEWRERKGPLLDKAITKKLEGIETQKLQ